METDLNILSNNIINWIRSYVLNNNLQCLVVGVSGGVDSGLVSTLCAKTNLPTYVVSIPINQEFSQLERARNHCKWLENNYNNIINLEKNLTTINILFNEIFTEFSDPLTNANTKSRLRMIALYQIAGCKKGIVVGTGNKVEDFGVGFYTKYGDGGVDISPIADLTKTEVRKMADILGVPKYIVNAIPTDGLWEDNRTDENQIGASYEELEWAMNYNEDEQASDRQKEVLKIYNKFNTQNKHKMIPIPIFKK